MNTQKFCCVVGLLFVACLWGVQSAGGEQKSQSTVGSYYEQTLREKHIEPTAAGLLQYFRSLHPDEAQRRRTAELIRDLGSTESFAKREAAMAQLVVLPQPPTEQLTSAAAGPDPEIRWRAKRVLETATVESDRVLYAALRVVAEQRPPGLTAEVLRAVPLCAKPHLVYAAGETLQAIAQPGDAETLRRELKSANVDVRVAVAGALGRAVGQKAAEQLLALAQDKEDKVKVAAARALANLGDRRSLAVLLRLLSSDNVTVRVTAAITLQALTGKEFAYAAYDTPNKREAAIAKWTTWVNEDGRTAKLNFPLKPLGIGASYLNGNTLLAYGYTNRVVEYDPSEREVWNYEIPGAWSAEKLPNGDVLIASNQGNRVVQVDRDKKVVWEFSCSNPLAAKALPGGNILIAEYGGSRALEVSPDKKIVWSYKASGNCSDLHRLENGNTLVAVYGRSLLEVTPEGETVWEYEGMNNSYGCQPLPGGNVLICDFGGSVQEVTRDKKVVWSMTATNPTDCFRLPNGNTLITEANRFIEVTPDKKIVWTKEGCSYGSARR
jgi:HEAT repeat protein